jgi:hypothetical protein
MDGKVGKFLSMRDLIKIIFSLPFAEKFEFQNLICVPLTHRHNFNVKVEGKLCGTTKSRETEAQQH